MLSPWLAMALVAGSLAGLMGILRLWQVLAAPHPELVRKLLHIGMGLVTLSFPWLFDQHWPIVVLAVASAGAMLALRLVGRLRSSIGSVVADVPRMTFGEVYFPVAVGILFGLHLFESHPDPDSRRLLYGIPILLLTLADALAALVGLRDGHAHYATSDGQKSVEGSLAFFLVAFLCVHVPLLLWSNVGKEESLLIGLLLAWLAMMFEAIAWAGLDNLVLPLVSYLLLRIYIDLPASELLIRLGVTAVFTASAFLYARRATLMGSAIVGVVLVGYICWALGGWEWLVPPLALFLCYPLLSPRTAFNSRRIHNVHAVICVASAGLAWLFLGRILEQNDYLYPATIAFAAHLAIIGVARLGCDYPRMAAPALVALCAFQGWLYLFLPYLLLHWDAAGTILYALAALPAVGLGAAGFYLAQPQVRDCPADTARWLRQAGCAALASTLGLLPILWL